LKWSEISREGYGSIATLKRWRKVHNFREPLRQVDDIELDGMIKEMNTENSSTGEKMVMGKLLSSGITASRMRIRERINRVVDPAGRMRRKRPRLKSCECSVC
jgi:hypothetical protein